MPEDTICAPPDTLGLNQWPTNSLPAQLTAMMAQVRLLQPCCCKKAVYYSPVVVYHSLAPLAIIYYSLQ